MSNKRDRRAAELCDGRGRKLPRKSPLLEADPVAAKKEEAEVTENAAVEHVQPAAARVVVKREEDPESASAEQQAHLVPRAAAVVKKEEEEEEEAAGEAEQPGGRAAVKEDSASPHGQQQESEESGKGEEEEEEEEEEEDEAYYYDEYHEEDEYYDYDAEVDAHYERLSRRGGRLHSAPAPGDALVAPQPEDQQLASVVYARVDLDGRHAVHGAPLRHVHKLLTRVFKLWQEPGRALWRSPEPLSQEEWCYIKLVLSSDQLRPALETGQRVLAPLPPSMQLPGRLQPTDASGQRLRGPYISRNGEPHNYCRQFFSNFVKGASSAFMWADGVGAFEPEAQASFDRYWDDRGGPPGCVIC